MADSISDTSVGVIGLGLMGSALADVLMTQGFDLRVWNRSRDKCERFAAAGVPVGDSPDTVAGECEVLVVCLTGHAVSMDVLQSGTLAKRLEGKTLVLLTTMTTEDSRVTAADMAVAATFNNVPEAIGVIRGAVGVGLPNADILGGCCGTDERHLTEIAQSGNRVSGPSTTRQQSSP